MSERERGRDEREIEGGRGANEGVEERQGDCGKEMGGVERKKGEKVDNEGRERGRRRKMER